MYVKYQAFSCLFTHLIGVMHSTWLCSQSYIMTKHWHKCAANISRRRL